MEKEKKPKDVRTERLEIRLTHADRQRIEARAKEAGASISAFMISAALVDATHNGKAMVMTPEAMEILKTIPYEEIGPHVSRCLVAVRQHELAKAKMEEAYRQRKRWGLDTAEG